MSPRKNMHVISEHSKRASRIFMEDLSRHQPGSTVEDEFRDWSKIARAMKRSLKGDGSLDVELIRIGLRILAIRADRNPVTAAYAAIPLIENALRCFITHIFTAVADATAFDSISDEEIAIWWKRGAFVRPRRSERLSGASLVLLAAVLSCRRGSQLFIDSNDVAQTVEILDQRRNALGHQIEVPDRKVSQELADCAQHIVESTANSAGTDFSVKALTRWVTPPQGVLRND